MSYKTILVHVDQSRHVNARIRLSSEIAQAEHAHLIGAALSGISRYVFDNGAINPHDAMIAHHVDALRQSAQSALDNFNKITGETRLSSVEARLVDDDAGGGMALQARYADLVVIGQPDPAEALPGLMPDFPEYVLMHSARPVLILPHGGTFYYRFKRPLIAWDASMTATRAVTAALPLLQQAEQTDLIVFNADEAPDAHGQQPGADMALYLARHGVSVTVHHAQNAQDTGTALLATAAELGSDLIVMGGYGHARFREILLGGVTRTLLNAMTVPVLMAH